MKVFSLILGIIFLLLLIGIIFYIRQKVKDVSRTLFGTESLSKGVQNIQREYEMTPKSVSGMQNLYLPTIVKDFPDFHIDEMRERAEHVLVAYLSSIHNRASQLPNYVNSDLKHQLELHLQNLSNADHKEYFTSIKLHQCVLHRYTKEAGKRRVTFQASVQYIHYVEDRDHNVISGSKTNLEQGRYNIDMIYIQDRDLVENASEDSLGLNCPNCGAAIKNIGQKFCDYCGSGIVALNINTWSFSDIHEK